MADQIEEIKSKTDIVALISEFIPLKKAGRNYKALCPFHSEKTPSFMVSSELQIFKCFGCQKGGDALTFLQEYEGMDFYEALKFLAQRAGVKLEPLKPGQKGEKEKFYEINSLISRFYNYLLLNHSVGKGALTYLTRQRGLKLDTIKEFQLGFSPDAPLALKRYIVDKKGISLEDLQAVGVVLVREGQAWERFRGRIIFPLFDHRGNICGFAGRVLPTNESGVAKYINTPETAIYHKSRLLYGLNLSKDEIKKAKEAVVMEGELDVISCWQVGIRNVVAIKGSALTQDQARLLSRFGKSTVLALDTDFAGDEAVRHGINIAEVQGLEVKVAKLSGFKDPDEAVRKKPQIFKESISNAKSAWDFVIDGIFEKFGGKTGEEKARISREIIPILATITDRIVQAHYINLVAQKLGVPQAAVSEQLSSKAKQELKLEKIVRKPTKTRREILEERLLAVGFRYNPEVLISTKILELVSTPLAKRILQELKSFFKSGKSFDPSLFAARLPSELVDGFTDLILKDIKGLEDADDQVLEKELKLIEKEIKILDIKSHLEEMEGKIRDLEMTNKKEKLKKAQRQFNKLTRILSDIEEGDFGGIIL